MINIRGDSSDWRARALSNFPPFKFFIDGHPMASVEGFIQGIKFPSGHPLGAEAFTLHGFAAKRLGAQAEGRFVWWDGCAINYGSPEHRALIEWAIRRKFATHAYALDALLSTSGQALTHDIGKPESPTTSLPAAVFCRILTDIRQEHEPFEVGDLVVPKTVPLFPQGGSGSNAIHERDVQEVTGLQYNVQAGRVWFITLEGRTEDERPLFFRPSDFRDHEVPRILFAE